MHNMKPMHEARAYTDNKIEEAIGEVESNIQSIGTTVDGHTSQLAVITPQLSQCVYNVNTGLRNWRAALAKVQASGRGDVINSIINVPIIGDSISEGLHVWADPTTDSANRVADDFAYSWVGLLQSYFKDRLNLDDVGRGLIHTELAHYYPYWTFAGDTWGASYSFGIGAYAKAWSGTADGTQTATFEFNGTGIGIMYAARPANCKISYVIDSGETTTIDTYSAIQNPAKILEVTGLSSGDHTIVITKHTDDNIGFHLIGAYEIKGSKGIRLNRCGMYGHEVAVATRSGADATTANSVQYATIDAWVPPLTIVALIVNDFVSQSALEAYRTNIQILITRAKNFGDVMLVSYCPPNRPELSIPITDYNDILRDLAVDNDCCFVDLINRWGEYTLGNALGFYADTVHPTAIGHQDIANALWTVLTS